MSHNSRHILRLVLVTLLMMSPDINAQEIEPGVGIWGVLEIGGSYEKQIHLFERRNREDSPTAFGIEVDGREAGVITRLTFRAPSFFVSIRGVPIKIGDSIDDSTIQQLARVAKMDRHDDGYDFPQLGVKLKVMRIRRGEATQSQVSSIDIYRPKPDT